MIIKVTFGSRLKVIFLFFMNLYCNEICGHCVPCGCKLWKRTIHIFKNVYIFQAKVNIVNDFMKLKY